MNDLKQVLTGISERLDKAGGAVSRQTRLALRAHRNKRLAMTIALIVFILCWLSLSAYLLIKEDSGNARALAALTGIGGTGGALEALRRVWKDYSQTDLLLILIADADEAQVTALINKLVKNL